MLIFLSKNMHVGQARLPIAYGVELGTGHATKQLRTSRSMESMEK